MIDDRPYNPITHDDKMNDEIVKPNITRLAQFFEAHCHMKLHVGCSIL